MEQINLMEVMDSFQKEKKELYKKLNPIKEKIIWFCDKYNAKFNLCYRELFEFSDKYYKEAFSTFYYTCYYNNLDNLEKIFTEDNLKKAYNQYVLWKQTDRHKDNVYYNYDFDKEQKIFNELMPFFQFFVEIISLYKKYGCEMKIITEHFYSYNPKG